jgi:HPt (histidine-containing phosphotransfer) domain-containing protein
MPDDPMEARLAQLRRLGGDKLVRELIDLLLEGVPTKLTAARAALAQGDVRGVGRVAHALASNAGNVGAAEMQEAAYALEQSAHGGAAADLAEPLSRLEQSWARARDLLAERKPRDMP